MSTSSSSTHPPRFLRGLLFRPAAKSIEGLRSKVDKPSSFTGVARLRQIRKTIKHAQICGAKSVLTADCIQIQPEPWKSDVHFTQEVRTHKNESCQSWCGARGKECPRHTEVSTWKCHLAALGCLRYCGPAQIRSPVKSHRQCRCRPEDNAEFVTAQAEKHTFEKNVDDFWVGAAGKIASLLHSYT